MAVGLILEPQQAEAILQSGEADLIALAREMLANPNFAAQAALALEGRGWIWSDQFRYWLNAVPRRSSAKGGLKVVIPSDPLKLNFVGRIPGAAQHQSNALQNRDRFERRVSDDPGISGKSLSHAPRPGKAVKAAPQSTTCSRATMIGRWPSGRKFGSSARVAAYSGVAVPRFISAVEANQVIASPS